MPKPVRLEATVSGRVQGVNFRAYAQREAGRLGLSGYASNLGDGRTVVVVAEGERAALERLLAWLRHGPPAARVTGVAVRWDEATSEFQSFEVRP